MMAAEDEPGISTKRALVYLAIVVVCFGTLYPRILHPMLKNMLGFGEKPKQSEQPEYPPHMRPNPEGGRTPSHRPGMRPPPGARGDLGQKPEGTGGSSGGVMSMILPVYAVGIVLYLIYTATKVYGGDKEKKKKKKNSTNELYSLITERLAEVDLEKVLSGEDEAGAKEINQLGKYKPVQSAEYLRKRNTDGSDSEDEIIKAKSKKSKKPIIKEVKPDNVEEAPKPADPSLDELLKKCENQEPNCLVTNSFTFKVSPEEMVRVQARLREVEQRMNKMMERMSDVSSAVSSAKDTIEESKACPVHESTSESSEEGEDEMDEDDLDMSSSEEGSEVEVIYGGQDEEEDESETEDIGADLESGGLRKRVVATEDS